MFEHSVPVPRHLKAAAIILRKVSGEGGSIKSLLYDKKHRHYNTNVLYALINESIKHSDLIDKIFEDAQLFANEPRLEPWLAKILTTELLFGKKTLPGDSKPVKTVLSYKEKFEKSLSENQDVSTVIEAIPKPRYVRINTNLLTTSDAIRAFQDEGYRFIRCTSTSYNDYLTQVQNLTDEDFMQDFHVKTILVFSPRTKFHDHELYLENKILLQDKATSLAVHLLAPPKDGVVLDMCAAPGMKTTQLSAYMKNQGKIYAVEQNENRFKTLCEFVEGCGCKTVETIRKDVLEIRRGELDDVEYILLDPSCSGSGMEMSVHKYVDANRLAKLTSLQEKFLKHAMNAFPKAKRIIYSTCSLHPEENERVVTNIVKTSRVKWRVQDVNDLLKGQWNNFGSNMYGSIGTRCLYAKPESDLTRGFFLAVIDRDFNKDVKEGDIEKGSGNVGVASDQVEKTSDKNDGNSHRDDDRTESLRKNKKKSKNNQGELNDNSKTEIDSEHIESEMKNINESNENTTIKRKNKKKHKIQEESQSLPEIVEDDIVKKKSKNKKHDITDNTSLTDVSSENLEQNVSKKKKKHIKNSETEQNVQEIDSHPDDDEVTVKKKKRTQDINEIGTETDSVETTNLDAIPKKKKRKKTDSIS